MLLDFASLSHLEAAIPVSRSKCFTHLIDLVGQEPEFGRRKRHSSTAELSRCNVADGIDEPPERSRYETEQHNVDHNCGDASQNQENYYLPA
jgi:hypothetical protein